MTPFYLSDEMTDVLATPGPAEPAPADPGDVAMWNVIVSRYEAKLLALERRLGRRDAEIDVLSAELHECHRREQMLLDIVKRERRADVYGRLQGYHEGLGGVGTCDCTMGRGNLIQRGLRAVYGGPGD